MVVITEFEEFIGITIGIVGTVFVPLLIFFSRLWQRVGTLEQQMETSIQVRKDLQDKTLPLFHQVRIDLEVVKERIKEISESLHAIKTDHERGKFD